MFNRTLAERGVRAADALSLLCGHLHGPHLRRVRAGTPEA